MQSGIINIYKEAGYTSFDVVAKLRGILKIKKIGHTGTLDPDAEGVLPVCIGKATKLCDMLTDRDKCYVAVMRLGVMTDTQDISGNVLQTSDVIVSEEEIRSVISSFVGEQMQIPPMYSALKVNGQKLCDLARKGQTVERQARPITIYHIRVIDISYPLVKMEVSCSKGTYIRTLCHDIGFKLHTYACMESLLRTKAAGFDIKDSLKLQEVEELVRNNQLESYITPMDQMFPALPAFIAKEEMTPLLENGNSIRIDESFAHVNATQPEVRMYMADGKFVGIFQRKDDFYKPVKMFLE